ncbi:MAG: 4Fe-4S dicluster domain-containing protein [Deltaproteobacteria bacterium]|nr:4Fe-4S dicluster domain-containing protein [Deltaproteobacteria bacterium]
MEKTLLVDLTKCTGCEACVDVCSARGTKAYSEQVSRIRISRDEPRAVFTPLVCEQCREHPCVEACPVEAIEYDPRLSIFTVDQEACTACGSCQEACPYDGIFVTEETALKCDLCGGQPACVEVCYPQALKYVEVNEAAILADLQLKITKTRELRGDLHD